jgi:RNA polymerase sigma-70 factor (subfamily 1)
MSVNVRISFVQSILLCVMSAGLRGNDPKLAQNSGSLERLLVRARAGSRSALGRLLVAVRPWLRRRVHVQLPQGMAQKQDASDLVQECQAIVTAQIGSFRGRDVRDFRAWINRILQNRILRSLRFWREKRRNFKREVPLNPTTRQGEVEGLAPATMSPSEQLSLEEDRERLLLALSWCREEDHAVISLHLIEGRSHDEIGAELGLSIDAVRQRYSRAIRRLREGVKLMDLLAEHRINGPQQEAIVLHHIRGEHPKQIGARLRLPQELVTRWIAEADPLRRNSQEDRA